MENAIVRYVFFVSDKHTWQFGAFAIPQIDRQLQRTLDSRLKISGFRVLGKAENLWLPRPVCSCVIDAEASHEAVFNVEVDLDITDALDNKYGRQAGVAWNDHGGAVLDMESRHAAIPIVYTINDLNERELTLDIRFQNAASNHELNARALEVVHVAKHLTI